jgi:hypothetical protein
MGFPKSQEEMVDCSHYLFLADHRHNAVFGGRFGSCSFYIYIILILEKKKRDYAKSGKIIDPKKDNKLFNQYTIINYISWRCCYYCGNNSAATENPQY